MAYFSIEPWGSQTDGARAALSCSVAANSALMIAQPALLKRKPFFPKDFYVGMNSTQGRTVKKQDWREQKRLIGSFVR